MNPKKLINQKIAELKQQPKWYKYSFPEQINFIEDSAKFKAAHCTRRAGKSYSAGLYLCKEAYENPGVSVLYIALTASSAERILWRDILKDINHKFHLKAHFDRQKLIMTLPNGSQIYLLGADSRQDDMDKFLGQKFKLVIIDEASKYRINIKRLIYDVLKPAVADYEGTIAMIGTADNFVESEFARITQGKVKGWSIHRWSALQNPHMKKQFANEMKSLREADPYVDHQAWFRQNYLGEWIAEQEALIYQYSDENIIQEIPDIPLMYSLGIVLSYKGYSAFSIVAWSEKAREAFLVETSHSTNTDLFYVLEEAERLQSRYELNSITCVDASKKLIQEIQSRSQLSIEESPEKDKSALMKIFTSELLKNNIKVFHKNADILREWDSIIKDEDYRQGLREHPNCQNHLATATLYAWHKCYNYSYKPERILDDPNDLYWEKYERNLKEPEQDDFEEFYPQEN